MTIAIIIMLWFSTSYYYFKARQMEKQRDLAYNNMKAKRYREINESVLVNEQAGYCKRLN